MTSSYCGTDNLEQTMFLGCSIIDFTCTLGLNEQPTEVTVRLVRDTCPSPAGHYKVYYDITQPSSIRQQWTAADPGLFSFGVNQDEAPRLGAPVYFRVANFEFMGLLQSWTKNNVQTDQDLFEVKLTSPTEILGGCQVVLSEYAGPIKGFNIFNVYGFAEYFNADTYAPNITALGNAAINGPVMGTYAGVFGGSNSNSSGMTWNKIKEALTILTSSLIPVNLLGYSDFSPTGRITYYGGQSDSKFGLIPRDSINLNLDSAFGVSSDIATYYIDVSEIPNVPDDYRISGPNLSILNIISQVCNDFALDYYVEFLPVADGNSLKKYIKIRTISRNAQPDLNIVTQFVSATSEVIDSSFGRELRNESTTTFLVGGAKENLIEINAGTDAFQNDPEEDWLQDNFGNESNVRESIMPYFGIDSFGNAYVLHSGSTPLQDYITLDLASKHIWKVLGALLPNQINVSIGEMRAAEHSYDDWTKYSEWLNTEFNQYILDAGFQIHGVFAGNTAYKNNRILARDLQALSTKELFDQFSLELRAYRQIIADIYTQAKSTMMVRVPWVASRYQIDSTTVANTLADLQVQSTDVPSEGGWSEDDIICYLANPSAYIDRLRLEDGRIKSFAFFDLPTAGLSGPGLGSSSTNQFDTEDSFAIDRVAVAGLPDPGNLLYYAFQQDDQLVYLDRANLKSPRVVIRFSNPLDFGNDSNPFFAKGGWNFVNNAALFALLKRQGHGGPEAETLISIVGENIYIPNTVAIALKSNNFVYGPWKPDNIIESGPPGQIKFEKDDDLVPWQYGSMANLGNIAQQRANASVSVMTQGEVGNITVPGWPNIPIGAELASLGGLTSRFFEQDQHLLENRSSAFTTATLRDPNNANISFTLPNYGFGSWNGSFGPTITSINVDVSTASNISTTYSFRTYSPKFGVMSKLNADRLQRQYTGDKKRGARERFFHELKKVQKLYGKGLRRLTQTGDQRAQKGTPHSLLVGHLVPWDSNVVTGDNTGDGVYRRSIVSTKSLLDIQNNLYTSSGSGSYMNGYDSVAIMSFDGLIRPVSMSGAGGLPRYVANTGQASANTAGAIPPFGTGGGDYNSLYNYNINLRYLNPLSNPTGFAFSEIQSLQSGSGGHDIDILARGNLSGLTGVDRSMILPTDSGGFYSHNRADYNDDYRFLALRGPLVLQGWGYDTNGKPIPNAADSETNIINSGQFATSGLQDRFLPNFLRKPQTWPVAPVDLRFDRQRNVWTSAPPYEFIVATLTQNISPSGSGTAFFTLNDGYDASGVAINSGVISVNDKVGSTYRSGDKVIAYYDNRLNKYNIIESKSSGTTSSGTSNPVLIVLIDTNISGATENISCSTGSSLDFYSYTRTSVDLKYFVPVLTGHPCFYSGQPTSRMTLATGLSGVSVPDISGTGTHIIYTGIYVTQSIFYDDGKSFILGEYTRSDYPTYPENSSFPPTGYSTGYFNKKYRGIAIDNTLITSMCKQLPAPRLTGS